MAGHRLRNCLLAGAGLLLTAWVCPASAQRHPESAGPLPYYRTDGAREEPEWLNRPEPFRRGPRDRYDRGYSRRFFGTPDTVPYLNYATEDYILYERDLIAWTRPPGRATFTRRGRWDRTGTYVGSGYLRIFNWEEARTGSADITNSMPSNNQFPDGSITAGGFSYQDHRQSGFGFDVGSGLQGFLLIGHYSYKKLHWTTTTGIDVRSMFTPLTLNLVGQSTARIDIDYMGRDKATILFARGGGRERNLFSQWSGTSGDSFDRNPILMYAARYQRNFRDYAKVGGTFLNQFMSNPTSHRADAWRGDLPYDMVQPQQIRVFVADDSPNESQFNARVYDVDIVIEGLEGDQPVRRSSIEGDPDFDPRLNPAPPEGGRPLPDGSLEARGLTPIVYTFDLPEDITVTSARFFADVADDYRLGVRQSHAFPSVDRSGETEPVAVEWPGSFTNNEGSTRRPFKWFLGQEHEPYYTMVRSPGQSSGGVNRKIVSFDHGMPTGQRLASVDFDADLVGVSLSGEASFNTQNLIFPVGKNEGRRQTQEAVAWWIQGIKELNWGMELGGEFYRLDPDYSGGYDSQRGGMAFHTDEQPRAGARLETATQEFPLQVDNDDNDQHIDQSADEFFVSGDDYPGWPNAGVYPGFDENADNIADPDRNENFIVDWEEPFLMYKADPPELIYDVDFNNNMLPDFRENDDLPDYPYRRDEKGRHLFLTFTELGRWAESVTIGNYESKQIVGGGESKSLYLRYAQKLEDTHLGDLTLHLDLKRVEDDIPDHSFLFLVPPDDVDIIPWLNTPDGPPEFASRSNFRPATPDPLVMRDSFVSTLFLQSDYAPLSELNLENRLVWLRNAQNEIELEDGSGLLQPEETRNRLIIVNKIDYTWRRGNLEITPKFKHRTIWENPKTFERNVRDQFRTTFEGIDITDESLIDRTEFIPILMVEYALTPRTAFLFGAQGSPLLGYKRWDRKDKNDTFSQTDYLGMLKMESEYLGFDSNFFLGYQRTRREFSRNGEGRDFRRGTIFVELIAPF